MCGTWMTLKRTKVDAGKFRGKSRKSRNVQVVN
jgi:hypothetical protein